jgi:hypothetical protein
MSFPIRNLFPVLASLLMFHLVAQPGAAQPRSGGYDFSWGTGTSTGEGYKNRSGQLTTAEVFFSTRMDGTNSPFLMGAQIGYFAQDDPTDGGACVFVERIDGCARNLPDMAMAGLLAAWEPTFGVYNYLHASAGASFVQPSSDGGPTLAGHASARVGRAFGDHIAVFGGGRVLIVPDLRGFSVTLATFTVGLRLR